MSDVEDRLTDIIVSILEVEPDNIKPSSRFQEDLDADSLEVLDLIMTVEDTFDIEVPDEKAETLLTVGDVIAFIKSKQRV